jgi:hypothetical protein
MPSSLRLRRQILIRELAPEAFAFRQQTRPITVDAACGSHGRHGQRVSFELLGVHGLPPVSKTEMTLIELLTSTRTRTDILIHSKKLNSPIVIFTPKAHADKSAKMKLPMLQAVWLTVSSFAVEIELYPRSAIRL